MSNYAKAARLVLAAAIFAALGWREASNAAETAHRFNVRDYGATGQKTDLATVAIQKAIDRCHVAGGETVYVPPGDYTTATIELKDNVTLFLEAGATLFASRNEADYATIRVHEHAWW
jgi:polygalacturonase